MKTVAIMQPTYLPWLGYFALISIVDEFIFLDDVQFERRSWQQRNRIKAAPGPVSLTIPVFSKGKRDQRINEVRIDWESRFDKKHARALEHAYCKAPFWARFGPRLIEAIGTRTEGLSDYTIALIEMLRQELGIETHCTRSSDVLVDGTREHRLVALCEARSATTYISPLGSRAYLDGSDVFDRSGIKLQYLHYDHPVYPQLHGDFSSHLSAADLVFNCGKDSLALLKQGVRVETVNAGAAPHFA